MLNRMVGGGALFLECAAGFDVNRDREALMIGHSMGGDIVMYFAKEYPDEVKWVVAEPMSNRHSLPAFQGGTRF